MRNLLALTLLLVSTLALAAPPRVEKAAKDSTVLVSVQMDGGYARGSAAYIGAGMFITNAHVVEGSRDIIIVSIPGTKVKYRVQVIAVNKIADIAIIATSKDVKDIEPVTFAKGTPMFTKVYAAGYGSSMHDDIEGEFLRVYGGGHAALSKHRSQWYSFGGDEGCSIQGDSGGPAFNENGEYIGPIWGTDGKRTYAVRFKSMAAFVAAIIL